MEERNYSGNSTALVNSTKMKDLSFGFTVVVLFFMGRQCVRVGRRGKQCLPHCSVTVDLCFVLLVIPT